MPKSDRRYRSVRERAQEGEIKLVEPLDYLILDALPLEGTMLGDFIPLGATVRDLVKTTFKGLDSDLISGRVRAMEFYGLTKQVVLPSARGWQVTKTGQQWLSDWKSRQNGKEKG